MRSWLNLPNGPSPSACSRGRRICASTWKQRFSQWCRYTQRFPTRLLPPRCWEQSEWATASVIGSDGLVLTIGYLITEAESIWLTTNDGAVVPGHALAYDQVTGFGLVLPLGRLDVPSMERGSASSAAVGDSVTVVGHGGLEHALDAQDHCPARVRRILGISAR